MKVYNNKGFTLLEVLIALTILTIGLLGIAGLGGTAIRSAGNSRAGTQATNIAQETIEALLWVSYNNIQASDATAPSGTIDLRRTCTGPTGPANRTVYTCAGTNPVNLGNNKFNWTYTVTYIDLNGDGIADPAVDGLKRIDMTVTWTDMLWHIQKSLTMTTLRGKG